MSSQHVDLFRALCLPFEGDEIKRFTKGGKQFEYLTSRRIMNRLDEVLGPENWWDDYVPLEHSVVCRLTIRLPDGQLLTKSDAGGYADMQDEGDGEKGGFADALKRAAVKFGVGRHLYKDGIPSFAEVNGRQERPRQTEAARPVRAPDQPREPNFKSLPQAHTPAAFYWFKDLATYYQQPSLLKKLEELAQAQDLPGTFKEWDQPSLDAVAQRAIAYCKRLPGYKGELDALATAEDSDAAVRAAVRSPVEGARVGLSWAAAQLWNTRNPGTVCAEGDIDQIIREVSAGRIEDRESCLDADLMTQTAQSIKRLTATAGSKR